jgi:hypothetical protein
MKAESTSQLLVRTKVTLDDMTLCIEEAHEKEEEKNV